MQRALTKQFTGYSKALGRLKEGQYLSIYGNVRCLATVKELFPHKSSFPARHIGPRKTDVVSMLDLLGYKSLDEMSDLAVPKQIQLGRELNIEEPLSKLPLQGCVTLVTTQRALDRELDDDLGLDRVFNSQNISSNE